MTSVVLNFGLETIGINAFYGCTDLESVTFSGIVGTIGQSAFANCTALESVTLPNGMETIPQAMFSGCTSLSTITIPGTVTSISQWAFQNTGLKTITIPDIVTTIGVASFQNCTSLESLTIGRSVTNIGANAFEGCIKLEALYVPNNVKEISSYAFWKCTSLRSVYFANGSTAAILAGAFSGCTSLKALRLASGMYKPLGFVNTGLTSVSFPVGTRGEFNVSYSTQLRVAYFQSGIDSISLNGFEGCTALTTLHIPASVTKIIFNNISSCTKLRYIYYGGTQEQWTQSVEKTGSNTDLLKQITVYYNAAEYVGGTVSAVGSLSEQTDRSADGTKVTVTLWGENNSDKTITVSYCVAIYKEGKLLSLSVTGEKRIEAGAYYTQTFELYSVSGDLSVKFFTVDAAMKPFLSSGFKLLAEGG